MATTALDEEKKRKAIGYAFPQNAPLGGSIYGVNIQPKSDTPAPAPVPSKPIGFSFPQNPPEGGSIYRKRQLASDASAQAGTVIPNAAPLQSQGMAVLKASTPAAAPEKPAPSLNAPWYSREYAAAANMSDKGGLELERMRAAGATGIPQNDPVRRLITTGMVSTGQPQPITSNEGRNAPAPVQKPSGISVVAAPAQQAALQQSAQQPVGQKSMQPTAPQQAATQADIQAGKPATTAMQQPLGKDIGFGIRKLEMPGETPVYMGEGPNPSFAPAVGGAYAPANRQINMPVLNQGMGVFSSMADFANQAGKAYGAIAQNKSDNKSARIGMDVVKMNSDISQNALKLGMDQQRADSDMGLNAIKQAQLNLQNNSMSALDAARQEYLAAGDDPAKQKAASKKLAVLSGKDGQRDNLKDNFIVVGGGQEYDQAAQTMRNVPQTLVDLRTGQPVALPTQHAQAKTAATGQKYTVGQTVVKPDGSRGRVVAIDANGMATEIQPL